MAELVLMKPHPKQQIFLKDKHKYVAFGGARGGGKSAAVDIKATIRAFKYPGIRQLIVRSTYKELEMNHIRQLKELYKCGTPNALAKYTDGKKQMRFPNGSTIDFDYCATEADLSHFQGGEWDIIYLDEACNFTEEMLRKITACMRGTNGFPKQTIYTCNPGGKSGFGYIKRLFIDKNYEPGENPEDYSFIQSLVTDNLALMKTDYIKQLEALPEKLRKAWLEGDWNSFEGTYFAEFRATPDPVECEKHGISIEQAQDEGRWTHVIEPFEIPSSWKIYRSYDWGFGKPFAQTYYAMPPGDDTAYLFLEVYGCTRTPNEGIKWTNKQQFRYFRELEDSHPWLKGQHIRGVADPSIWDGSHDGDGISAAEEAERNGIFYDKGNNSRVSGWMQVRERLKFDENGKPRLYIFNTCKHVIRTLPLMMFDEHKVEDLDTSLEDHLADTLRYYCQAHRVPPRIIETEFKSVHDPLNMWTKPKSIIIRR